MIIYINSAVSGHKEGNVADSQHRQRIWFEPGNTGPVTATINKERNAADSPNTEIAAQDKRRALSTMVLAMVA